MAFESCLSLMRVSYSMRDKFIQASRLQEDGFLLLKQDPELWIQNNAADLLSVQFLELQDVEKIGDSIGKLSLLTRLFIFRGAFKCLPNSISSLPNLQRLKLLHCHRLQELPADLGDLKTLTSLSLIDCSNIKSLPNSIQKLPKLISLHLIGCPSLKELPAISNVAEMFLDNCPNILPLPKGLCNLKDLLLTLCCKESIPDFIYFPSLCHLTFHTCYNCQNHQELPANLDELSELLTLNIQFASIKWLPWSIAKLSKLRLLSLPHGFRLETLPKHLNDSIIISVEDTHIRKTWKQLKTELQLFSIPIVGVEATHSASTPGYLHYRDDPGLCLQSNGLHSLVQILDLELRNCVFDRNIINSIGMLPELTHLYISAGYIYNLPLTLTTLTHLSLFYCDLEFCCDSLAKLSTLQSLTLHKCRNLPEPLDLPVSLKHFALGTRLSCESNHYMASIKKLWNLKTLNLSGYADLELSQLHMNLTKIMLRDCNIKSLPRCVQHLEIFHSCFYKGYCDHNTCCDELEFLYQAVNLRTLSVTCRNVKALPSIPEHKTLQELQLKDCFKLEYLPSNLDELVELHTLNVSGTRIKSLPHSITRLQNLQHLILPKCFILKSLPKNLEDKVRVSIDDTDDIYYQYQGCKDDKITSGSTEGGDDVVSQGHGINIEQAPSHSLLKPLPDATQVHEEDGQDKNPQSVDVKHKKTQKIDISKESIQECMSKGMTLECAAKEYEVSRSTMKRKLKELGMTWLKSTRKRHEDAKNKSPSEENSSQPGSCSTFDVKATYNEDTVRIYKFALSSGIEQLKEKVGEKLGLEASKFKMKFLDEDNDWVLMSCFSDLEHAFHLSKSSGSSVVKLSVIPAS